MVDFIEEGSEFLDLNEWVPSRKRRVFSWWIEVVDPVHLSDEHLIDRPLVGQADFYYRHGFALHIRLGQTDQNALEAIHPENSI